MRIGISIVTHDGQNIWENGLGQNIYFLSELFRSLEFVQSVILIDVGDQGKLPPQVDATDWKPQLVTQQEATDEIDVVVEMGGLLDPRWLDLMRARGKKVVYYCCGQPYVSVAEPAIFNKAANGLRADRCDQIWLMPKDRAYMPFMRTLYRCEVYEVPYIWYPKFIKKRSQELVALGLNYGYCRERASGNGAGAGMRAAIFEPNISVVKSLSIPMLICDEAYRKDSDAINSIHILNALHLKDHPTMLYFANSLDLIRQHKATFHGRHDVAGFMAQHADAVVAHHWMNEQNYAYLDVLYGDYPLIHNSEWIREAGYYYHGFDTVEGAQQLLIANRDHNKNIDEYRARSQRVFGSVNPFNTKVLNAYAERLLQLCSHERRPTTQVRS